MAAAYNNWRQLFTFHLNFFFFSFTTPPTLLSHSIICSFEHRKSMNLQQNKHFLLPISCALSLILPQHASGIWYRFSYGTLIVWHCQTMWQHIRRSTCLATNAERVNLVNRRKTLGCNKICDKQNLLDPDAVVQHSQEAEIRDT